LHGCEAEPVSHSRCPATEGSGLTASR
jgi:hypothetical protein